MVPNQGAEPPQRVSRWIWGVVTNHGLKKSSVSGLFFETSKPNHVSRSEETHLVNQNQNQNQVLSAADGLLCEFLTEAEVTHSRNLSTSCWFSRLNYRKVTPAGVIGPMTLGVTESGFNLFWSETDLRLSALTDRQHAESEKRWNDTHEEDRRWKRQNSQVWGPVGAAGRSEAAENWQKRLEFLVQLLALKFNKSCGFTHVQRGAFRCQLRLRRQTANRKF